MNPSFNDADSSEHSEYNVDISGENPIFPGRELSAGGGGGVGETFYSVQIRRAKI